jgi:signal transduction histidine kinase
MPSVIRPKANFNSMSSYFGTKSHVVRFCSDFVYDMFRTLRVRLVILLAVAALPAFALIVFVAVEQRSHERDVASDSALRYAETMGLELKLSVDSIQELLESLAKNPVILERNVDACNQFLTGMKSSFPAYKDANFFAADERGNIYCADIASDPGEPQVNIADRPYFQQVRTTNDFAVGEYQVGRLSGVTNIALAEPVFKGGEFSGVVLASMPLDVLSHRIAAVPLPEGSVYRLLDRHSTVLATNLDPKVWVGQQVSNSGLGALLGKTAGSMELTGLDDRTRLYGYTPVGDPVADGLTLTVGIPTDVAYGNIDRDMIRNLTLLAVVTVLSMTAAWVGAEVFVGKQTRRLVRDVRRYASGDTKWQSPRERGGIAELGELRDAFDNLVAELAVKDEQRSASASELEEVNAHLERRVAGRTQELNERNDRMGYEIEQRKAAEAEMQRYAADLAKVNQDLEEFTYAVSHDLKAPLRGISGFASMVIEDNATNLDDAARENLTIIMQGAEQMRRLIDDLLQLSRIGRTEDDAAEVSMLEEVREIESEMKFALQERGIVLNVASDLPVMHSGRVRIKQVLRNLIGNAVKYDDGPNPVIEVGWHQNELGSYTFFVRDNGKGIDPRFHDRIFRVFQRLDPRQETEGTGIGLTICKKAVESLGGKIWVESEPGAGSTFFFSLPITNVEATHEQPPAFVGGGQPA